MVYALDVGLHLHGRKHKSNWFKCTQVKTKTIDPPENIDRMLREQDAKANELQAKTVEQDTWFKKQDQSIKEARAELENTK